MRHLQGRNYRLPSRGRLGAVQKSDGRKSIPGAGTMDSGICGRNLQTPPHGVGGGRGGATAAPGHG